MTPAQRRFLENTPRDGWSPSDLRGPELAMARRLEEAGLVERRFLLGEGECYFPTDAAAAQLGRPPWSLHPRFRPA